MASLNAPAARRSAALRLGLAASTAFAAVLVAGDAARAACDPAAANNVTATCTGVTTNQGPGGNVGYGNSGLTNLTVNVLPGATVTGGAVGLTRGIQFETGTVFNAGTIIGLTGIEAEHAVVNNSGTILGNNGILAIQTGVVTNSGTIQGARGIQGDFISVTNSGTIRGLGIGEAGIVATSIANVTNSGTISGPRAILAVTANINNTGFITGSDTSIEAHTASVSNSGTISGDRIGILGRETANISNSGSIIGGHLAIAGTTVNVSNSGTIAAGLQGISTGATGNVTNSGTIIGESGTAIWFNLGGPAADSLTILPGARFGGLVDFGGGADRVTFGPGSWILNTANFDAALSTVTTSGNPYVVTPNQIIVADTSGFAAMNRAIMDITGWIGSVLPDTPVFETAQANGMVSAFAAIEAAAPHFDDAFSNFPAALPYAPTPVFKGGSVRDAYGNSFWAKGFGGHREQGTDNNFIGNVTTGWGGAIGLDGQVTTNTRLGAFVGGSANKTKLNLNAGQVETDTVFGGVYARTFWGTSFLDLALIGGTLDNDSRRNIGGGLAFETASASYNGWFINPALTLGHSFVFDRGFSITPAVKARYVAAHFDAYTETGSVASLTVADRDVQAFEERAEITLASVQHWNASRLIFRATGGVMAQQRTGDSAVNVILVGQNFIATTPDAGRVFGAYGSAGFDWQIGRVAWFASGEVTGMNDKTTTFAGKGGMRVVW